MKVGFKLMLVTLLIAAVLLTEVDCGKKNKKEVKTKKGKENRGGKANKFAYNESPKVKERKLKLKAPKKYQTTASEESLSGKKAGKLAGLKIKPTATEKIIEQIVHEEIVIEEELPVEEETEVVVEEETVDDIAPVDEEETEEIVDEVAPDVSETAEGNETLEEAEFEVEEIKTTAPLKVQKIKRKVAPAVEEAEEDIEAEPVAESLKSGSPPKTGVKSPKTASKSGKKEKATTKKVKAQKIKRKTEL